MFKYKIVLTDHDHHGDSHDGSDESICVHCIKTVHIQLKNNFNSFYSFDMTVNLWMSPDGFEIIIKQIYNVIFT